MYISFNQLSDEARIWVYQASRPFGDEEKAIILREAQVFLAQWASHGSPLQCSAALFYDQFLVLAVEESVQNATGCAIDDSVRFIRELEQAFEVSLLDRTHIAFRRETMNWLVPLEQLQATIQQGAIFADMLTFDNTITSKKELTDKWLVRAGDSWFRRYFHKQ